MKLIPFTFTNDYDKRSVVHVNPAFVIRLRPDVDGDDQTAISFSDGSNTTVDGTIEVVSQQLCGDDRAEETTSALDKMPDSG